ncbi:hypothetical protein yc1106_06030 [Curvularia clavata]|uniref:Aminoglycoside phosphotransferase domain-containing protein n=1 Tax=Curvularia clavata TaxID=95742 RepID=A0A9Q9DUU1_CURCL|nr:hypothetical protein yc1106_06030 [Curvularia clavata]
MTPDSPLYIADGASLPATLPTVEEIESATEILSRTAGRKVVGVGEHFVVKYGKQVDLLEGETQLFLEQETNVPVPRIYALFQSADQKDSYIVMERIKGSSLASEWPKMNQASKETVSSKLRSIFEEMRKIETPGGYCSVGHRGLPDGLFWTNDPSHPFSGPFDTETELNNAMLAKYVEDGHSRYKADYYSRTFKENFQGHVPVFSHADFQRKNVMLRDSSTATKTEVPRDITDWQPVIIDWEFSGWYPSYWEYSRAIFACGRWEDDWNCWVDRMLEPFRNETAWVTSLLRELWS